ncbi:hypothetical protein VM1G_10011 [Cytospora mali]|uniref:RlpA-like protein double-psi beta-barrel domain-containing protein n=1 Tax=Cytospora mali TaxID=578113 RepID=A0A194WCN8_CYTMA|nr:hypothetical protein VM1G_10011 [Valsa mali]
MKSALAFFSSAILALTATATPHKRATYDGHLTPIGEVPGAYTACGQEYEADSMYVAVNPILLPPDCSPKTITINCPTGAVTGQVLDKCMRCGSDHIDVSSAVYVACGGTKGGIDPINNITWSF